MIILAITNDAYNNAPNSIKISLNNIFNGISFKNEKGIYFKSENVNWDSSVNEDCYNIDNWLYDLDSFEFGFVSETIIDTIEYGRPYLIFLNFND